MNQKQHYTQQVQCQGVRVEDERQELFSFLFRETARHTPLDGTKKTDRSQQDDVPDSTLMQQQEDIRKLSLYDHVTGLPNRMLFLEEIEHLTRKKHPFTILSLDFNQLHQINEQIGFDIGDQWLRQTSQFLTEQLPDMYCSRLAGDHYAALWTEPFDELQLKKTCLDLLSVNTTRFQIEGYELAAELAIGISPFQTEETTATELLHTANRALSRAKLKPQPAYEFYTSQLDLEIYRRHQLEQSLRNAIEQKELFLEYQPKVDIWSGQILTCEALIRWDHPEWGRIPHKISFLCRRKDTVIYRLANGFLKPSVRPSNLCCTTRYRSSRFPSTYLPSSCSIGTLFRRSGLVYTGIKYPPGISSSNFRRPPCFRKVSSSRKRCNSSISWESN